MLAQDEILDLLAVHGDELSSREVADGNFLAAEFRNHSAVHRVIELDADVRPIHLSFRRSSGGKRAEKKCAT